MTTSPNTPPPETGKPQVTTETPEAREATVRRIVKEAAQAHDFLDGHGIERLSEPDDGTGERHWLPLRARIKRLESQRVNDGGMPDSEDAERPAPLSGEQSHDGLRDELAMRAASLRDTPVTNGLVSLTGRTVDDTADMLERAERALASEREKRGRLRGVLAVAVGELGATEVTDNHATLLEHVEDFVAAARAALASLDAGESELVNDKPIDTPAQCADVNSGQSREARQATIANARDTVESGGVKVGRAVQVDDDRPERPWRLHPDGTWDGPAIDQDTDAYRSPSLPADREARIERVADKLRALLPNYVARDTRPLAARIVDETLAGAVPDGRELERLRATKKLHDQAHDRLDDLGVSRTSRVDVPSVRELPERIDLLAARAGGRGLSAEPSEQKALKYAINVVEGQRGRNPAPAVASAIGGHLDALRSLAEKCRVDAVSSTEAKPLSTDVLRREAKSEMLDVMVVAHARGGWLAVPDALADWLDEHSPPSTETEPPKPSPEAVRDFAWRLQRAEVALPKGFDLAGELASWCEQFAPLDRPSDAGLLAVLADPPDEMREAAITEDGLIVLAPDEFDRLARRLADWLSSHRGTESEGISLSADDAQALVTAWFGDELDKAEGVIHRLQGELRAAATGEEG